jgi:hypothetical protein
MCFVGFTEDISYLGVSNLIFFLAFVDVFPLANFSIFVLLLLSQCP